MTRIAVVGGYGVGLTVRTPRSPGIGETILGSGFSAGPGGKGSNQAVGAVRLGARVDLLTAVGQDRFGQDGISLWLSEGISADKVVTVEDKPTMAGFIMVEPTGDNRIIVAPGALARVSETHVMAFKDELERADVCLVSLEVSIEAAVTALHIAHAAGTTTILNPAPAVTLPASVWQSVDYVTPNESEAATLCGLDDSSSDDERIDSLRRLTGAIVVMTTGHRGAFVDDGATRSLYQAPTVDNIVDTTGAGDAFSAAFATAIAERQPLKEAVEFANAAGAISVQRHEVVPSLPRRNELEAFRRREAEIHT